MIVIFSCFITDFFWNRVNLSAKTYLFFGLKEDVLIEPGQRFLPAGLFIVDFGMGSEPARWNFYQQVHSVVVVKFKRVAALQEDMH